MAPPRRLSLVSAVVVAAFTVAACQPLRSVQQALQPPSPHEAYTRSLETAGLQETALAREWLEASRAALAAPSPVEPPFEEVQYVDPSAPRATAYAVAMRRGQHLLVEATLVAERPGRVFVDVFEPEQATLEGRPAASAEDGTGTVQHTSSQDGVLVVRVQPELLRGGELRVRTVAQPALLLPVEGATARSIQGLFGAPRDAGAREHEGIDIFAPRGTRVLAAAGGRVSAVGENPLGGRVVWLQDERGYNHYYAHLDTQLISTGARVSAGDVLGTVGNTGNARTTTPHLHFGLYARGEGAVDPRWFVQPVPQETAPPVFARESLGAWVRIARARTALRKGPGAAHDALATLDVHTAVSALGGLGRWVRVELPDGTGGFVQSVQLARMQPWRRARATRATPLRTAPAETAPRRRTIEPRAELAVLGRFHDYLLVRVDENTDGWVPAAIVG